MMDSDGEREKESVHYFLFLHPPLSIRPAVYARIPHFSYQGDGGKKNRWSRKTNNWTRNKFYNKRKRPIGFLWERLDFPLSYNDDVVWGLVVLMVRPEEKRKKIFFVFFFFTRKIPVETSFWLLRETKARSYRVAYESGCGCVCCCCVSVRLETMMTERESVYYAGLVLSFVPVRSTFDQESFYLKRKKRKGKRRKKIQSRSALAGEKPADSLESISEPSRPPWNDARLGAQLCTLAAREMISLGAVYLPRNSLVTNWMKLMN